MPSRMVNDRRKSCEMVEASVSTHGRKVADALDALFSPHLADGETPPDLLMLFTLTSRHLAALRQTLVEADERHLEELADDDEPRRRRDETSERLREKLRRLRDGLGAVFGSERLLELTGVESAVAQDSAALTAQVKRVLDRFTDPGFQLDDPRFPGFRIEPQPIVDDLRPDYEELTSALRDVKLEAREAEATLVAKRRAIDAYDQGFRFLATVLETFYALAGETEIAARVRPSQRRPGQTEEMGNEPAEPEPPSAPEPAAA